MGRTPNDDRSDSMNPNNDAYWDSLDNHADQLNPNNDEYRGDDKEEDTDDGNKQRNADLLLIIGSYEGPTVMWGFLILYRLFQSIQAADDR